MSNRKRFYWLSGEALIVKDELANMWTAGTLVVPAGWEFYIIEIAASTTRILPDEGIPVAPAGCTFSIDAALSAELYTGIFANCLNLVNPTAESQGVRMIYNAKAGKNETHRGIYKRGDFVLPGGVEGSTYYFKLKNEDLSNDATGNVTVRGVWF